MSLKGKIAVVTGASRGIGRGIALQLGEAGATVYVTGRRPKVSLQQEISELPTLEKTANEINERGGHGIVMYVDHSDMSEVNIFFENLAKETNNTLDILVNNAYSGISSLSEVGEKKFWQFDPSVWDDINNVGLRNHYYCCVYAARLMVPRKSGLIINISSAGGMQYIMNVAYGVGKCAVDRMSSDMAMDLRKYNVAVISLWPGYVRTELCIKYASESKFEGSDFEDFERMSSAGESPEFPGKAVVALAEDPNVMKKSGNILITADVAMEYGFRDIDGRLPASFRSIRFLLNYKGYTGLASYMPCWLRLPGWIFAAINSRL